MRKHFPPRPATLICVAMLGSMLVPFLFASRLDQLVSTMLHGLRDTGLIGACLFVALQFLVSATGFLPASLLGIGAGAAYGFLWGSVFAVLGTLAGAIAGFHLGRRGLRNSGFLSRRLQTGLRRAEDFVVADGWRSVFLIRLSPAMPFAATSMALGASRLGERNYLIGTSAALPALLGYVYAGSLLAGEGSVAYGESRTVFTWALVIGSIALVIVLSRFMAHVFSAGESATRNEPAGGEDARK
jgi:uncharacterized membrane protein YdjX (TVP38/TMEM64 family)